MQSGHHNHYLKKNFVLFLINWQLHTYLTRLFCLSGKQDYKKTKPALRAARLKAEAKKNSSGFRVNLRSPPLSTQPLLHYCHFCLCRPSFVRPTTAIPSVGESNNTFPPAPARRCVRFPLKNPGKDRNVLHGFCRRLYLTLKKKKT